MRRLLAGLILLIALAEAAAAQRVALVIGNGAYREAPPLANPAADARGMASALSRLGFRVELVLDADRGQMERAIRRFGEAAAGAEAAMVFYAGHAVEVGGRNHLIPVSASIRSDRDLPFETIDFDTVITQLEGRARVILVFLDACRDNPFRQRLTGGGTRGMAAPGLAPVRGPVGTLVAFATAPGQVAQDGAGQNSPFTAALLAHIETPGLEVRPMLGRVRQAVREATGGAQVPWENSSLEGEFFFRPAPAAPRPSPLAALPAPAATPSPTAPRSVPDPDQATERLFWESVKDSRSPDELRAYLRRYPDGVFADLAQTRIAALERAAAPPSRQAATAEAARQAPAPSAPAPPVASPPPVAAPQPAAPQPAPSRAAAPQAPAPQPAPSPAIATAPPRPPPVQAQPAPPAPAPTQEPRQMAARPIPAIPPSPPAAEPAPPAVAGRGGTLRVLTHLVPLPPGPWREAGRTVEPSSSDLAIAGQQVFPVHTVTLVQEQAGRAVAAIRIVATHNTGPSVSWVTPEACRAGGSLANALVATMGIHLDCWVVRRGAAEEVGLGRSLPGGAVAISRHAVGDSRNALRVDYVFTQLPAERLAAWAPEAHAALRRGFLGRLAEGLASP